MQGLAKLESSTKDGLGPNASCNEIPPVPPMLQRALESLWEETIRKGRGLPQEGFATLEKEFREKLLKLGANLLGEALPHAVGTGYEGYREVCAGCGGWAKFVKHRPRTITTLVQEIRFKRAYYHCSGCGKGEAPLDRILSLDGTSFSPGVREAICLLDAEIPFDRGSKLLKRLSAIGLDKQEGRHIAEGLGRELEKQTLEELENTCKPQKPVPRELAAIPERIYFSPDGTTVPIEKDWKEAKVGAVFTTGIPRCGQEPERDHTRYAATMGDADDLGKRMYVEALKLGFDPEKSRPVVVADGAHWIWNWAEVSLPKGRVEIIDFYHASEKLWEVKRAVFGEENPQGIRWAETWRDKLYKGKVDACIRAMERLKPRTKEGRECVRKVIGYYGTNRKRMSYNKFRRQGYFIGSGVTESSCKRLVGARMKQAGMRWTREGAQAILQLRLALLNDRWDYLWAGCGGSA